MLNSVRQVIRRSVAPLRGARWLAVACLTLLHATGPSVAASDHWVAAKTRGTVLVLQGDNWVEVTIGDVIPLGEAIRTLQSGRLELSSGNVTLRIEPLTALRIDHDNGVLLLTQLAGAITLESDLGQQGMVVEAKSVRVVIGRGHTELRVNSETGDVVVSEGSVAVSTAQLKAVVVEAGQTLAQAAAGQAAATVPTSANQSANNGNSAGQGHGSSGSANPGNSGAGNGNSSNAGNGNSNAGSGNSGAGNGNGSGESNGGHGTTSAGGGANNGNANGKANGNSSN